MARRGGLQVGVMGQFVMLALAWGASFLFIKVGLEGLSPRRLCWVACWPGRGPWRLYRWLADGRCPASLPCGGIWPSCRCCSA